MGRSSRVSSLAGRSPWVLLGVVLALGACGDATAPAVQAPDLVAPTVALVLPAADTTYSGPPSVAPTRAIRGMATDTVGVVRATYRLNGGAEVEIPITPGTSALLSFAVRTEEGDNELVVYAYDAAGNRGVSPVRRLHQDSNGPRVDLLNPPSDSTVSNASHTLRLRVSDPSGVDRLEFRLNGSLLSGIALGGDTATSLDLSLALDPGRNSVELYAYDRNGNWTRQYWALRRVGVRFQDVIVGASGFCGLDTDGVAYCQRVGATRLANPEGAERFRTAAVGNGFACGISTADALFCWSSNFVAPGTNGYPSARPVPSPVLASTTFRTVTAAVDYACAIAAQGAALCWGTALNGQLGIGNRLDTQQPTPVAGGRSYAAISAGGLSTCALTDAGEAFCWGDNRNGQLGNGTTQQSSVPVAVATPERFGFIAAGYGHSCAVTPEGSAYCWGNNQLGQLGTGAAANNPAPVTTPVPVAGGLRFTSLALGQVHSCGLTAEGRAYCLGDNTQGALGTGDTSPRAAPTPAVGGLVWTRLSAYGSTTCGVTVEGLLYCWGAQSRTPQLQEGQ